MPAKSALYVLPFAIFSSDLRLFFTRGNVFGRRRRGGHSCEYIGFHSFLFQRNI